jgi:hypothetical protein
MPLFSASAKDANDIASILKELEHDSDRAAGLVGAVLASREGTRAKSNDARRRYA